MRNETVEEKGDRKSLLERPRRARTTSELLARDWIKSGLKVQVQTANGTFNFSEMLFRIQKTYGGAYEFTHD